MKALPTTIRSIRSDDILLRKLGEEELNTGSILYTPDLNIHKNSTFIFEVISVGSSVTDVTPGQRVLVPWGRVTPGFQLDDDKMYHYTSVNEVLAVFDADAEVMVL